MYSGVCLVYTGMKTEFGNKGRSQIQNINFAEAGEIWFRAAFLEVTA